MSQLTYRAFLATLATGAVVASGAAFGAPAFAAPDPDMYGPTISQVTTTSEGLGGSVSFKVEDNPGLSSIDLRDPATDAIFYRRVVDFPGNVTADGVHHYSFEIKFSDIQAAWTKAGHTEALPATVKLVAWGSDGKPSKRADVAIEPVAMTSLDFGIESGKLNMTVGQQTNIGVTHQPENANMTKINWSGDDIDVLNVDEESGLVTALKEGCSDVRAVSDYMDPMVFDPVMATVNVCATELGEDEIAVNHLRVDMEEGETVTLKPLLPKKFKDATLTWGLEYGGAVILKAAEDGKSATITGGNVADWDQVNLTATLPDGTEATATTIAVVKSVKQDATAPAPWVEPQPDPQPQPEPQPQPAPTGSWMLDSVGWWYRNADGSYPAGKAMMIDGRTYRFDASGYMRTGWVNDAGTWYFHDGSGAQLSGWQAVGGSWYYLGTDGAMRTGWVKVDGTWYFMDASGAMRTGWLGLGGTWYYLQGNGAMSTGWQYIGGSWYYLDTDGAMRTGWVKVDGTWYFMNPSGSMYTGWLNLGGTWYYLQGNGAMATGHLTIGSTPRYFDENGVWIW